MIARCFVCGWSEVCANRPAAGAALREHTARAQHPLRWCQECHRNVPTHENRYPEHYRPVAAGRVVRCGLSGKPAEAEAVCVRCGHAETDHPRGGACGAPCPDGLGCSCPRLDVGEGGGGDRA